MKCWSLIGWSLTFIFQKGGMSCLEEVDKIWVFVGSCEMCMLGFGEFVLNGVEFLEFHANFSFKFNNLLLIPRVSNTFCLILNTNIEDFGFDK